MKPQTVEIAPGLVWTVAQPTPASGDAHSTHYPPPGATDQPAPARNTRPFWITIAVTAAWLIVTVLLLIAGALTPPRDNLAFYLVSMTGLLCAAFVVITCPRPDPDENYVTIGGCTVAQCTPSRQTITGRN